MQKKVIANMSAVCYPVSMKNGAYNIVKVPPEYPGKKYRGKYAYEHTLVWWQNTQIIPPKRYHIHHRNGIKDDNRFKNLELVHLSTHLSLRKKKKTFIALICEECKKPYLMLKSEHTYRCKTRTGRFYCSRVCSDKIMCFRVAQG